MRSTSTAMPRLTGPPSIANGLPSRSSKMRTITGKSLAACAIAQATRWVKETFIPRSLRTALSALRLASSVSTAIVRNEVAVGTSRLSSIALASIAAGPRSGFASPAAPEPPLRRRSRPRWQPRAHPPWSPSPRARDPLTAPRSTPSSPATRRATGVARTSVGSVGARSPAVRAAPPRVASRGRRRASGDASSSPAGPAAAPPGPAAEPSRRDPIARFHLGQRGADRRPRRRPSDQSLVITPAVGAGTSASTLSVETSTTVSPSLTKSPSATCHSSTMPSVTDSPISGIWICDGRRLRHLASI